MRHTPLRVSIGQCSQQGRKAENQDAHGVLVPSDPLLTLKGIAVALADGISTSSVSAQASQAAVRGFLEDYYCTSEAWSVKTSVERVVSALNSWLCSQTRASDFRYDPERGYVCTFSALVLKARLAHVFHAGDTRVYRVRDDQLELLTRDHRSRGAAGELQLTRALGVAERVELDYRALPLEQDAMFVLATDGVYEHVTATQLLQLLHQHGSDLDAAAAHIVRAALDGGSQDNLSLQIVRVESLPDDAHDATEVLREELAELPLPPPLEPRMRFDGYTLRRQLHASHRSHVYLAEDDATGTPVVIKTPAVDLGAEAALLERFLLEEWIARRIDNAHVLKPYRQARARSFVYLVTEYVEGQTLAQWMIDHPRPSLDEVRAIVTQIALGLYAFHRLEMVHQDLRPENLLIDRSGSVRIIDFGSVQVAGIAELLPPAAAQHVLGSAQYAAPEALLGEVCSSRSDLFSLGVLTYQMLSGRLPYGAELARARTRQAQLRLCYVSVLQPDRQIPAWVDYALRKAVQPDPARRYAELSELIYDLHHPSPTFLRRERPALLERDPVKFWKGVSALLSVLVLVLLHALLER